MPLGLGLASSHAPGMWRPPEQWANALLNRPPEIRDHLPYTAKLEIESLELRQSHYNRIHAAFAQLRDQLAAYKPDFFSRRGAIDDRRSLLACIFRSEFERLREFINTARHFHDDALRRERAAVFECSNRVTRAGERR